MLDDSMKKAYLPLLFSTMSTPSGLEATITSALCIPAKMDRN
jgi:hypothetical protein